MNTNKQFLNRLLIVSVFFISSLYTIANDILVRSIAELTTDISARSAAVKDDKGNDCAIVRVNIPTIKSISFDNIVGNDVKYEAGEYTFYISEGTKEIPYHVDGYKTKTINFDDFNISVKGKCVYRVTLYIQNRQDKKSQKENRLIITTEPETTAVLLDGKFVGFSPLNITGVTAGKHTLSFPKIDGYELANQTIKIQGTVEKHYKLLKDDEIEEYLNPWDTANYYSYFDHNSWRIPINGSDNDATGWWPIKYFCIKSNGKYGILDYFGKIIVPCEFDKIASDSRGDFFVVSKKIDGKLKDGLFKTNKGLITPCIYERIFYKYNGNDLFHVKNDGWKDGYINEEGQEVIPCVHEKCISTKYNLYIGYLERGNTEIARLYDKEGNPVNNINLKYISFFHEGYATAEDFDGNRYLIDSLGVFHSGIFDNIGDIGRIESYSDGLVYCQKRGDYGIVNLNGKVLIPFDDNRYAYDYNEDVHVPEVSDGWAVLQNRDSITIADKNGNTYTCSEKEFHKPVGHFLPFVKNNKMGLYDQTGTVRLAFEFNDIYGAGDYIIAQKEENAYIYDYSLKEILTLEMPDQARIQIIKDGIIRVEDKASGKYGYFNMKGEVLVGCFFEKNELDSIFLNHGNWVQMIFDGMAIVALGNRYGIIDKYGDYVEPLIYRIILPFDDGSIYARTLDGSWIDLGLKLSKQKNNG